MSLFRCQYFKLFSESVAHEAPGAKKNLVAELMQKYGAKPQSYQIVTSTGNYTKFSDLFSSDITKFKLKIKITFSLIKILGLKPRNIFNAQDFSPCRTLEIHKVFNLQ